MNPSDGFDRTVSDWLHADAEQRVPDHLNGVLRRTGTERQRSAWSSLERWLPVQTIPRPVPVPRVAWLLVIIALIAALAVAALAIGGRPHLGKAANGTLVFVDGDALRTAASDGTIGSVITGVPQGADQLTISPDGSRLAYRTVNATTPSIIVAESNGSNPVAIVSDVRLVPDGAIAWSPDSRRLAFPMLEGAVETIAVIDDDGSHLRQLDVGATATLTDLPWSPDGQWIAYFSTTTNGSSAVRLIHPDGNGEQTVNTGPVNGDGLVWSPDPGVLRLAYAARLPQVGGSSQGPGVPHAFVKVYDLGTASETLVAETSILHGSTPSWSPDGTRISWWNDGTHVVTVTDAVAGRAGSSMVFPAVDGGCSEHPELAGRALCGPAQWSPDGQWLYGLGIDGTAIVFGRSDGTSSTRAITLEQPVDPAAVYGRQVAWQAVAP